MRPARRWWWVLTVLLVGAIVALVLQPWVAHDVEPDAATTTPSPTSALDVPDPKESSSTVQPVGSAARFDAGTAGRLLVTPTQLATAMPGAAAGLSAGPTPTWGLPAGSAVDPDDCTDAVTVVGTTPRDFQAQQWRDPEMSFEQRVSVLASPRAAQRAFRVLVQTVDACSVYTQSVPGADSTTWSASPAIEGQGVYPSIVQERTQRTGTHAFPDYRGHLLVGNTIVTWTATDLHDGASTDDARKVLGEPEDLDQLLQTQAQHAVEGLG
ncbi:sensor domain-containing protein [Cellulomonas sp. HZM]|uniref:sensor domain-containing protein n=1 Tax=Cellulomonas sp. HZM TaxID=1454010 RepID=UPI0018CC23D4|nr:sensor domain-containing protein [Cellulomonas sp. HZM]